MQKVFSYGSIALMRSCCYEEGFHLYHYPSYKALLISKPIEHMLDEWIYTIVLFKHDFLNQIQGKINYLGSNLNQINGQIKYWGSS